jgi:hypothetical protein
MLCFGAVTSRVDQLQAHNRKTFRFIGTVRARPLTWLQCFASRRANPQELERRLTKYEREDEDEEEDKDKDKEPEIPQAEGGAA